MPVQPQVLFLLEEHPVATKARAIKAREVIFTIFFIISYTCFVDKSLFLEPFQ
jgi:hypothetical protein